MHKYHNENIEALLNLRDVSVIPLSVEIIVFQVVCSSGNPVLTAIMQFSYRNAVLEGGCPFHLGLLKPNLQERAL